uniref:Uncharacterized protein n=2 Tax=viral metagenome TaxID=1070528 RepID=A0A6M3KTQ4_9ZZZZ
MLEEAVLVGGKNDGRRQHVEHDRPELRVEVPYKLSAKPITEEIPCQETLEYEHYLREYIQVEDKRLSFFRHKNLTIYEAIKKLLEYYPGLRLTQRR